MPEIIRRGDVVWGSMSPTVGYEQGGHRPHLVLSDEALHRTRNIAIVVPLTTTNRAWPTRVKLPDGSYAIGEQPITMSLNRITKVEHKGYDTRPVVNVINNPISS